MSLALACDLAVISRYDAGKIARVAAFIVSAHGEDAVAHAHRLEAASAVPDMARLVRMEVERLARATMLADNGEPTVATRTSVRI